MTSKIPAFLLSDSRVDQPLRGGGNADMPYIEKGIRGLAELLSEGYSQWERSEGNGFLPASYQFVQTNLTIQTTLRKIEILILRR